MARVIEGWEGVHDQDGAPVGCTPENRALAANIPYFAKAAVAAYFERFDAPKNS